MKLEIYTAPLLTAMEDETLCPFCALHEKLENDALDFVMGPSYMEPDLRENTNKLGFCVAHLKRMFGMKNRLGMALMLQTHLMAQAKGIKKGANLKKQNAGCYVCERVDTTLDRYYETVLYLWKRKQREFEPVLKKSKICLPHTAEIMEKGDKSLNAVLSELTLKNLDELGEDIEWFIYKFDYRYADEPWRNSKDAVERGIRVLGAGSV